MSLPRDEEDGELDTLREGLEEPEADTHAESLAVGVEESDAAAEGDPLIETLAHDETEGDLVPDLDVLVVAELVNVAC